MESDSASVLKRWTRLELPEPDKMSEPQRYIYDRAVDFFGGPYGPRMPLLFKPELDTVWTAFGAELQKTTLPKELRELAILLTARCWDSQFEWHAHEPMAERAGLSRAIIDAVKHGRRPESDNPVVGAIHDYVTELLRVHAISDRTYRRLRELLGPEQLTVLTVFVGYYSNVAISLAAHAAPLPNGDPNPLPLLNGRGPAGPRPVSELYADANGAEIYARVDGDPAAPPLLLANSLGTDITMWEPQMDGLTQHFRVIRYDHRGHGRSDATPAPYSLDRLGQDAVAVLDAVGVDRARVAGVSLGGMIAQWLGVKAPERVSGLVIANTASYIGGPESVRPRIEAVTRDGVASIVDQIVPRWFTAEFVEREPRQVERIKRVFCGVPKDGYAGCCAALGDLDFREALGAITVPTTVIGGEFDPAAPPDAASKMAAAIPGAKLLTLPAAHLSNVERPVEFTQAILDLLG